MCTYNGARYLRDQLNSFSEQTCTRWTVFASDDASTDETLDILAEFQQKWGEDRLVLFKGPCEGFARNFISLVKNTEIKADFFAFSDQDDIWFADKLARSIDRLKHVPENKPALYCSRTRLIDADKQVIGLSPLFSKPPTFQNALVQSLAGANTMLINRSARDLLLQLPEQSSPVSHDWLTYLIVSGCDGEIFYDAQPTLDYRQHDGNLIGAKTTGLDKLKRLRGMFSGRFAQWNDRNLDILNNMKSRLSEENQKVMTRFEEGRKEKLFKRLIALNSAGVYRQTLRENLILLVAVLLGRI
ncbi:glycosyltransferase family 2 protein [Pseudomonas caspiana]|uniref:Glycosyl transferase family 2 n=1 Tax=Pseudomonas caspiana TaxID=1451454 RepID=A0A1Y3NXV4_9PSED|nr:glycosyl transferase family 2 [Pseudomonas caspiana]